MRLSDEQIAAVVAALRDDRSYRYVNAMATELLELRALRDAEALAAGNFSGNSSPKDDRPGVASTEPAKGDSRR
jgi:hypothetical protein